MNLIDISVVLVKPRLSGNVGAVARAMKNFGLSELVLVRPVCNHLSKTARNRAKWANNILKDAKVVSSLDSLSGFALLIGTTGRRASDYNILRSSLMPDEMIDLLQKNRGRTSRIGLCFGPEDRGFSNDELKRFDFVVSIPTNEKYPVMNLSHSVAVLLYELFRSSGKRSGVVYASQREKSMILGLISDAMDGMDFPTKSKLETQKKVWRRVLGKSQLTKREAFALVGFFKRLISVLRK